MQQRSFVLVGGGPRTIVRNRFNLAVVAWVQDLEGNRVLQAAYENVHWSGGENQRAEKN